MALAYLVLAAWRVSRRSLWLDELHTAWTVSGPWSEIPALAGGGNQQPYYFAALKPFYETVSWLGVQPEVALRLPSIVAWLAIAVGVGLAVKRFRWGGGAVILAVGLVVLDQRQLFYGTEARVYMQQQLLGLIGWLAVWWLCEVGEAKPRRLQAAAAVWLSSSAAVCLLHLASIAVVFCQCGVLLALGLWARRDSRLSKLPMAVRCMVLFFPGVVAALALTSDWWLWNSDPWESSVWERRDAWRSFAGGSRVRDFLRAVQVHWVVLPAVAALVAYRTLQFAFKVAGGRAVDSKSSYLQSASKDVCFWLIAALSPAVLVWGVAWLEVAPMLHQRYLVSCYAPMALAAAAVVSRIPSRPIQLIAAVLGLVTIACMQGSVAQWRAGDLVPWQRVEGWRQASRFVNEQFHDGDRLWVSSGLIEAVGQTPPLEPVVDHYLSYPLRSIYKVMHRSAESEDIALVEPHALLNSSAFWFEQLTRGSPSNAKGPNGAVEKDGAEVADGEQSSMNWVVFRGPPAQMKSVLARLVGQSSGRIAVEVPPRGFGSVSVAKLRVGGGR